MQCEQCAGDMDVEQAHSMLVVLQKVDQQGYSFYQCNQGSRAYGHTWQHWHCSHDEMKLNVASCITDHYEEAQLERVPLREVRLHEHVLSAGLTCKVCQALLTTEAYRFCLTVATPVNSIPDDSHNHLGEWCCSLLHAKQSAIQTIERIENHGNKENVYSLSGTD